MGLSATLLYTVRHFAVIGHEKKFNKINDLQSIELTVNHWVGGSSPSRGAI